jgi:TRAP transporter TAXI family solute receptor
MTRNKKIAALVIAGGFFLAGTIGTIAQDIEVNIMTGGATGTYIQFGSDIAALAVEAGRENVIVVESAGSMENIQAVKVRPRTQFGIVQSDVLDFIRTFRSEDAQMRSILRNTRIVFPLYKEEVQIVTTKSTGINTISDLSGKIVGVGLPNSGTNLTATFLFEVENVRPRAM